MHENAGTLQDILPFVLADTRFVWSDSRKGEKEFRRLFPDVDT